MNETAPAPPTPMALLRQALSNYGSAEWLRGHARAEGDTAKGRGAAELAALAEKEVLAIAEGILRANARYRLVIVPEVNGICIEGPDGSPVDRKPGQVLTVDVADAAIASHFVDAINRRVFG